MDLRPGPEQPARGARRDAQGQAQRGRATVHAQATIDYANVEQEKAALIDLAEDGMSVQFGKKLPPLGKVYFQFRLPDQTLSIRLSAKVMWQDWKGRAGLQFVDVPKASRRLLDDFLGPIYPKNPRELRSMTSPWRSKSLCARRGRRWRR